MIDKKHPKKMMRILKRNFEIYPDKEEYEYLTEAYPEIKKEIDKRVEYFKQNPFPKREKIIRLEKFKEYITLINPQGKDETEEKVKFRLTPFNEFNKLNFKKEDYVVKHFFTKGEINLFVGASELFKSFKCMLMASCIARGINYLDQFKTKKLRVAWLDKENSESLIQDRFRMIMRGLGIRKLNNLYILPSNYSGNLTDKEWLEQLLDFIEIYKIEVLFFDTMHRFGDYKENSSDDINNFYLNCLLPIKKLGCSVVLIHHTTKQGDFRGSSDIKGMIDNMFSVKKDKYQRYWFNFEKRRAGEKKRNICFNPIIENDTFRIESLSDLKEIAENKTKQDILIENLLNLFPKNETKREDLEDLLIKNKISYSREGLTRALKTLCLTNKIIKIKIKRGFYKKC